MDRSPERKKYGEKAKMTLIEGKKVSEALRLKMKDEVAYVRFASVYREFKDIETFLAELNQLKKEEN